MPQEFTDEELELFLDEQLPAGMQAAIEEALRRDRKLLERLEQIWARRDCTGHSLGAIWRRHRIGCPNREQLAGFLLGTLEEPEADYVQFHIEVSGCRYCEANLADLREQLAGEDQAVQLRRRRYWESSLSYLRRQT